MQEFREVENVVLLAEDVDRNVQLEQFSEYEDVVLLAEDVDRNKPATTAAVGLAVVLLAEDVDRNMLRCAELGLSHESCSSRRAWIEI